MFGVRLICNKKDLLLSIIFIVAIFYVLFDSNSISLKIFKGRASNIILILCCVVGISTTIVLFTLYNPSHMSTPEKTRDFYLQVARIFATLAIIGSMAMSLHGMARPEMSSEAADMFKLAKYSIVLAVSFVLAAVVLSYARLNNRQETLQFLVKRGLINGKRT